VPVHSVELNQLVGKRTIAERGECFQQCLFVCQHDNFRTMKRKTIKLGG